MIAIIGNDIQFKEGNAYVYDGFEYEFTDLEQFEMWAGENHIDYVIPSLFEGTVYVTGKEIDTNRIDEDGTNH